MTTPTHLLKRALTFLFFMMMVITNTSGLNYAITFTATGAASTLDSVRIENLTQGTSRTINGYDVLRLIVSSSGIVEVSQGDALLSIHPNPTTGNAELSFLAPLAGDVRIIIYDIAGHEVIRKEGFYEPGVRKFRLSGLDKGMYYVKISGNGYDYNAKLLSLDTSPLKAAIEYTCTDQAANRKGMLRSVKAFVDMPYTVGDNLRFTGFSDNCYVTVLDVPTCSKNITFNFSVSLATVTTSTAVNVLGSTATTGGTIVDDGGCEITARGVCYSLNPNPTAANSVLACGSGSGSFVADLTGLTPSTLYYVRAYATNSMGTTYGNEISFTTFNIPVLSTTAVYDIGGSTAMSGGYISSDGGLPVTLRGVCWGTTINPVYGVNNTMDGMGTGPFNSTITGLTPGTPYYVRAYAFNNVGIAYGNNEAFTTLSLASLTTTSITSITNVSASGGGNVVSDGGTAVTERGLCWSTNPNPTTADYKTVDGAGTGIFISSLTQLLGGTLYYVRAYAKNSAGTAYGNQVSFNTAPAVVATLTTEPVGLISISTAYSGGEITSNGGAPVTSRGVCWSMSPGPTIANSVTNDGSGSGIFSSVLTALDSGTLYYVRAYATNSAGTGYGNEISFTTLDIPDLTTTAITMITNNTASCGGNITSDGGASVSGRGVCWSTMPYPTITDANTWDGTGTGSFTSAISGLTSNTVYYVRAYATNSQGTAYGNMLQFTSAPAVGDSFQGGIVGYVFQSGDPGYVAGETHGLIAPSYDQSPGIVWYNGIWVLLGTPATDLGTGSSNTTTIVNLQGPGNYAAKLCYDLVAGGYSDWFLPSKDELHKLYLNKVAIGGFSNTFYSTSSEFHDSLCWEEDFTNGLQDYGSKSYPLRVRAVRYF